MAGDQLDSFSVHAPPPPRCDGFVNIIQLTKRPKGKEKNLDLCVISLRTGSSQFGRLKIVPL